MKSITTLIPAYKPKYVVELLNSLRYQTLLPAKVIFSDDSPNGEFTNFLTKENLKKFAPELTVEVIQGPRTTVGWDNFRNLLNYFSNQPGGPTEIFHFLLDDDIIYPSFYEEHLKTHNTTKLSCVISRRWLGLESGQPIRNNLQVPQAIIEHPSKRILLTSEIIFKYTIGNHINWLGEFSNATFNSKLIQEIESPNLNDVSYAGLEDLGSFLKASLFFPIGYIKDFLGCFRTHSNQNTMKIMEMPIKLLTLANISTSITAEKMNLISVDQLQFVLTNSFKTIITRYQNEADMLPFKEIAIQYFSGIHNNGLLNRFLIEWDKFTTKYYIKS